MKVLIVTGGSLDRSFAKDYLKEETFDLFIAADSGMSFFYEIGKKPDYIVGDFDSADKKILDYFRKQEDIIFREFCPQKDETDTELALTMALGLGADEICVLGATGNRIDHVIGNIFLLCKPLKEGIPCILVDKHNRIRLVNHVLCLEKKKQFGKYVSVLPLTQQAGGVNLHGFKYPLNKATLTNNNSLGVSNEITDEVARIEIGTGIVIVIESAD